MPRKIEISHRTIIFAFALLGGIWVVLRISSILVTLFIAILLTTALEPIVSHLTKFRIPRGLAILITYLVLIGLMLAGISSIVSPLVDQTTNLVERLPFLFDQLGIWLKSIGIQGVDGNVVASQFSQLGAIPTNIYHFFLFLFSNLISVITVLVITFYMLLERKNLNRYLLFLFGSDREERAKQFVDKLEASLGGWVRGELLLMLIIGLLTYLGLRVLGISSYAVPLAIIAGVLEVLPNIGPIIAAVPGILVGFMISPVMGLGVAALYFLIQQLENSLIVPKIMQRATGVNPLVTIISLGVGFQLAGPLGAILAVPIVITIRLVLVDIFGFDSLRKVL